MKGFPRWAPGPRLAVFVAVALLQVGVACWAIYGHEQTIRQGETFVFEVRPVDPYDPLRGRYVSIDLSPTAMPMPSSTWSMPRSDDWVYVTLGRDASGLVTYAGVSHEPPDDTDHFLKVHVWRTRTRPGNDAGGEPRHSLHVELPFDRYYLNEDLAPEAERLVWPRRAAGDGEEARPARLEVRVFRGRGVPVALTLDGRPIEELAAQRLGGAPRSP